MEKKLYRSRTSRMIAGVCGGVGEYLNVDPTIVRLFFILLAVSIGIGVVLYFLLWIIIPSEDARTTTLGETALSGAEEIADHARTVGDELRQVVRNPTPQVVTLIGGGLIIVGFFALLHNLSLPWLRWLRADVFWPSLFILAGLALLIRHWRGN